MTLKFIHLTDLHLVPRGQPLCGLFPEERLASALAEIDRLHRDAAFALLTGDLSYHGREPAYRLLKEMLDECALPCHLVLGNHDDREAFVRVFGTDALDPNGFVQYHFESAAGRFVVLDTVEHGQEHGVLCDDRLAWLAQVLEQFADEPIFLCLHHPPFPVGIASIDRSRLKQSHELGELLKRHGGIRHIFYGHVHRAISGAWLGIPASTLPGTNHQVGLHLGTSELMFGTHEPPAYGVCLVDDDNLVMHQKDFTDQSVRFVLSDARSKQADNPGALVPVPAEHQESL